MYVTNLTDRPLGIDNIIVLQPNEKNRYVNDTGDICKLISRLVKAKLIKVGKQMGLTKIISAQAVKRVEIPKIVTEAVNTPSENIEATVENTALNTENKTEESDDIKTESVEDVSETDTEDTEVTKTPSVKKTKRGRKNANKQESSK